MGELILILIGIYALVLAFAGGVWATEWVYREQTEEAKNLMDQSWEHLKKAEAILDKAATSLEPKEGM